MLAPSEIRIERPLRLWLALLSGTVAIVLIAILWIDKPVAFLVNGLFGSRDFSHLASSPVVSLPLIAAFIFVAFGILSLLGRRLSQIETAVLLCDISALIAEVVKDQLKYAFGRTWPDSWGPMVTSLIHDGEYRFYFFSHAPSLGSFPSGHATFAASVLSVLWLLFPKLGALFGLTMGAVAVGLVLLNLHFVSDVIAGTFVGASTGLFTMSLRNFLKA
jgi:membrane-associated phospholipid phosphatase